VGGAERAGRGAIGNLIWAVQSRTVPVFFGRRPPRLAPALGMYNLGTALVLIAAVVPEPALRQPGLGLAGAGAIWLALLVGTGSRLAAAFLEGTSPAWYRGLLVLADLLTWAGLALFGLGFARAWLHQGTRREALARSASSSRAIASHDSPPCPP
jgi:hypothetical protein